MPSTLPAAMLAALAIATAIAASCALISPAAEQLGEGIKRYCREPLEARRLIAAEVNKHAAPHAAAIRCAGDPT